MTRPRKGWAAFPDTVRAHSRDGARVLLRRDDCFAGPANAISLEHYGVVETLEEEGLRVYAGAAPASLDTPAIRAVYSFEGEMGVAVPSGRVFVTTAAEAVVAAQVAAAGYLVESVPPYAPRAAWLVSADGSVASALRNLDALMATDGIESVEPQMLRRSVRRD